MHNFLPLPKLWWRNATIAAFIFAAFFPTVRAFIFGDAAGSTFLSIGFSILADLIFASIASYCLYSLFAKKQLDKIDLIFLGYIAFSVIYGSILSHHKMAIIYGFRMTYLPMFMYFVGRNATMNEVGADLLKKMMLLVSAIAVVGLLLYFPFHNVYLYIISLNHDYEFEHQLVPRMTSLFYTPLVFSSVVAFASLYYLILYRKTNSKMDLLLFILNGVCLILSISRGAILAFIIMIPVFLFLLKGFKKIILPLITVLTIATLCINAISPKKDAFFLFGFIMKSSVNTMEMGDHIKRVDFWTTSVTDFKSHPMGFGLGKSGHVANRLFKDTDVPAAIYANDGWYLKLLLETGIPGFLFFVLLMFFIINSVLQIQNSYDKAFFLCLLLIIGFQSIVSNVPDFTFASFFLWLLIGLRSDNSKRSII